MPFTKSDDIHCVINRTRNNMKLKNLTDVAEVDAGWDAIRSHIDAQQHTIDTQLERIKDLEADDVSTGERILQLFAIKAQRLEFEKQATVSAEMVTFTPFLQDGRVGYRCTRGGQTVFVYLNPSTESDDQVPNIFIYIGETGDINEDGAAQHIVVMEACEHIADTTGDTESKITETDTGIDVEIPCRLCGMRGTVTILENNINWSKINWRQGE